MSSSGKLLTVVLIFQIFVHSTSTVDARENTRKLRFYVGMDMGLGLLNLSRNNLPLKQNSCFALGFNAGIIPFKWLRTGINLNGWTIESYGRFEDDPSKGISISNFYGQIQLFPFRKTALYANISGGFSNYINMHPGEFHAKGSGALLGIGYETRLFKRVAISLKIDYGFGGFKNVNNAVATVKNQQYNVTEFLIGITYH
jgi:hypothetical protein